MVREVSLVGQTPSSAPDPLVRLFHDAQDRPTRASAADQGVCPTMRIYSMNYGYRRLVPRPHDLFAFQPHASAWGSHWNSHKPQADAWGSSVRGCPVGKQLVIRSK